MPWSVTFTGVERGADLHMPQLMPLTVSCFSKIRIGFIFLESVYPDSPGERVVKLVRVIVETSLLRLAVL